MPELPEVETTARGLSRYLDGEKIGRVAVHREGLRRPFPPQLAQVLTGAKVTGLSRRAKYGLVPPGREVAIVFPRGRGGAWRIGPAETHKHDHLVIETAAGHILALCD